jgi:hypothetical protein
MSATPRDTETKKERTFTEKEVRKHRKKARQAEEKFKTTNYTSWLNTRDKHNDIVFELLGNQVTNVKKEKKQTNNMMKTDDQLLNEAIRQNRREKNERMKDAEVKGKKKQELYEKRSEVKKIIREKKISKEKKIQENIDQTDEFEAAEKEFRVDFIKGYLEKYPEKDQSEAQKESRKEYKKMIDHINFKNNVVQHFIHQGMTLDEATSEFNKMMGQAIAEKQRKVAPTDTRTLCSEIVEDIITNAYEKATDEGVTITEM